MVGRWPQKLVELLNDPAADFLQWRDNGVGGCHVLITDIDAYKAAFEYSNNNTAWRQQFTAYSFRCIPLGPFHSQESTGYEYEHPVLTARLDNTQCYLLKRKPEINARTNASRKRGSDDNFAVDALTLFNEQMKPKPKRGRPRKSSMNGSDSTPSSRRESSPELRSCTDIVVADRQQQQQQQQMIIPNLVSNYTQQQTVPDYALSLTQSQPQQQYEQQLFTPFSEESVQMDIDIQMQMETPGEIVQSDSRCSFDMIEVTGYDTAVTEQQQEEIEPSFTVEDLYDDSQPFTEREVDQFEKMIHDDHDHHQDTVPSWIEQTEVDMILNQATSGLVL